MKIILAQKFQHFWCSLNKFVGIHYFYFGLMSAFGLGQLFFWQFHCNLLKLFLALLCSRISRKRLIIFLRLQKDKFFFLYFDPQLNIIFLKILIKQLKEITNKKIINNMFGVFFDHFFAIIFVQSWKQQSAFFASFNLRGLIILIFNSLYEIKFA